MASKDASKKGTVARAPAKSVKPAKAAARKATATKAAATKTTAAKATAAKTTAAKTTVSPRRRKPASKRAGTATLQEMDRLLRRRPEVTSYDTYGYALESEEDYFVAPEKDRAYGRCGGRAIRSLMEKRICDKLSYLGVAHSHRPRRYEVKSEDGRVAAYSPCIVLRGKGREGKTAIIEVLATVDSAHVRKVQAFRRHYEAEFYVIFAAPGLVFDAMPQDAYDEAVLPAEVGSLVARLAE